MTLIELLDAIAAGKYKMAILGKGLVVSATQTGSAVTLLIGRSERSSPATPDQQPPGE
jgi:hypothetical protein